MSPIVEDKTHDIAQKLRVISDSPVDDKRRSSSLTSRGIYDTLYTITVQVSSLSLTLSYSLRSRGGAEPCKADAERYAIG